MEFNNVLKSVYDVQGLGLEAHYSAGWRFDEVSQVRVLVCVESDQAASRGFSQFTYGAHCRDGHGLSEIARPVGPVVNQHRSSAAGHDVGIFARRARGGEDKALEIICYRKSNQARIRSISLLG